MDAQGVLDGAHSIPTDERIEALSCQTRCRLVAIIYPFIDSSSGLTRLVGKTQRRLRVSTSSNLSTTLQRYHLGVFGIL
jgi:hypothetical protein